MNSPAHDTALYLVAQDIGTAFGTGVFVGREPLSPVECVTVYDTGGGVGPLVDMRVPTVQVRIRSADYNTGWQRANAAHETLTAPAGVTGQPDIAVAWWTATSDVAYIGRDDQDRVLFTANYTFTRSE